MRFYEFKQNIKTPLTEGARIDHAEDLIFWQGAAGAARAVESLKSLEQGGHKNVTVKWDGSPAIIFGRNADGEFTLTDKSGFGAKGYDGRVTSAKGLQQMLMNRPGFSNPDPKKAADFKKFIGNMSNIFDVYEKAIPKDMVGYFKGDLLYYQRPPLVDGHYEFKPQIVKYSVDAKSDLGQRIAKSTTGVVVHRMIDEQGNESALPENITDRFEGDQVLVFPSITVEKAPQVTDSNVEALQQKISRNAAAIDKVLNTETLTGLKLKGLKDILYRYTNHKVDSGFENVGSDFLQWLGTAKLSDAMRDRLVNYIGENKQGFDAIWEIVNDIADLKNKIISQLDKQDTNVKQSINNQQGGEGYVLAHPEGDIKLVNRAGFTAANRAVVR